MQNFNFTQAEAEALVGKKFETRVEWDGIRKGTHGSVIWASGSTVWASQGSYENYEVVIEWDPPYGDLKGRERPLQDRFSKFQMQEYMRQLKS